MTRRDVVFQQLLMWKKPQSKQINYIVPRYFFNFYVEEITSHDGALSTALVLFWYFSKCDFLPGDKSSSQCITQHTLHRSCPVIVRFNPCFNPTGRECITKNRSSATSVYTGSMGPAMGRGPRYQALSARCQKVHLRCKGGLLFADGATLKWYEPAYSSTPRS